MCLWFRKCKYLCNLFLQLETTESCVLEHYILETNCSTPFHVSLALCQVFDIVKTYSYTWCVPPLESLSALMGARARSDKWLDIKIRWSTECKGSIRRSFFTVRRTCGKGSLTLSKTKSSFRKAMHTSPRLGWLIKTVQLSCGRSQKFWGLLVGFLDFYKDFWNCCFRAVLHRIRQFFAGRTGSDRSANYAFQAIL